MPLPAPYISPAEVAKAALAYWGVIGAGQQPTADDLNLAESAYGDLHAEMTLKGAIDTPYEALPREMRGSFLIMIAARIAVAFGKLDSASAEALEDQGRRRFNATNFQPASIAEVPGQYY